MRIDRRRWIILTALASIACGFVGFLWLPSYRNLERKQREVDSRRRTLELAQLSRPSAPAPRDAASAPALDVPSAAIPPQMDLGALLEDMSETLSVDSIVIEEMRANTVVRGADFARIPLTLRFEGSYEAFFDFVRRAERGDRLIRFDHLEVTGHPAPGEETPMVQVTVELSAFSESQGGS